MDLYIHLTCQIILVAIVSIFALIYRQDRQPYLQQWLYFQVGNVFTGIFLFIYLFILPWRVFNGAFQLGFIVSAYCLLKGTYMLINQEPPRITKPLLYLGSAWMVVALSFNWSTLLSNLPGPLLAGYCFVATGWLLLRQKPMPGVGRTITAIAFILWGLHNLDRPFLVHIPQIVPFGYAIAMGLGVAANLGLVLTYFDVSREAITRREKQFRLLADNARDILFRYRLGANPGFDYISPSAEILYGFSPVEHYKDPDLWCRIVDEKDRETIKGYRDNPCQLPPNLDLKVHTRLGEVVWLEQTSVVIFDANQQVVAIEGIMRDISQRRLMEEQLRHLSLYDSLTGVYNRSFLEMKLAEADQSNADHGGVIIGDLDGLKLVNDALGHLVGDQLLRAASRVLAKSVRGNEIIARMGGDEFVILLPEADAMRVTSLVTEIYDDVSDFNQQDGNTPLSISLGYAVRQNRDLLFTELLRQADNNMYRGKLLRSRVIRRTMIQTLAETLAKRDFTTETQAESMEELAVNLGKRGGLSESNRANLMLLVRFHDLGKVGVPDRVLFKVEPLTLAEHEEIQRHCEIGYRIAQSGPELNSIADWILKHHEWWNGQGYPLGLSGQDIPLECRIMAIVDAFNAMTSERPYRRARSIEYAVDELHKGAGSQFDPQLVPVFIEMIDQTNQLRSE